MVKLVARVIGVGIETADMLVHEILSRHLRDQRAVARYAGLTGLIRLTRLGHDEPWAKAASRPYVIESA
jgi:hypothetical protein